jgi:2-oxo-4-hydroxy-4-carboxy-5-ureidoimidazoline decarboxylase
MTRLADGNARYWEKFDFIFIVFASGKSAFEMLTILEDRLQNDRETEILNAAKEQRKITLLRLEKMMRGE